MAIYTRIGDYGETGLLGGARLNKDDSVFDVLGTVDELNSNIGLAVGMMESVLGYQLLAVGGQEKKVENGLMGLIGQLRNIQRKLFEMGSVLAKSVRKLEEERSETDDTHRLAEVFVQSKLPKKEQKNSLRVVEFDVAFLENLIDKMEEDLPKLTNFILPGGGVVGAQLTVTRAVCRRMERFLVRYLKQNENEERQLLSYVNRLSDYFFVMSRWVNWLMREDEKAWR